jgi:hypothetical protein
VTHFDVFYSNRSTCAHVRGKRKNVSQHVTRHSLIDPRRLNHGASLARLQASWGGRGGTFERKRGERRPKFLHALRKNLRGAAGHLGGSGGDLAAIWIYRDLQAASRSCHACQRASLAAAV